MPETLGCATPRLAWWHDFWASQPIVFRALAKAPIAVGFLVLSTIASMTIPSAEKIAQFGDGIAMLALTLCIIFETWSEVSGTPRQDHKNDYARIYTAFGASCLYSIAVLLGGVLFLVPGIYVLISASLAVVFICVEQYPAVAAFEASRKLVSGRFWRSMRYLLAAPLLSLLVLGIGFFVLAIAEDVALGQSESAMTKLVDNIVGTGISIALTWLPLSIVPLQVRLFHALKVEKGELPNPSPHAEFAG
jgi:hypothetical protein